MMNTLQRGRTAMKVVMGRAADLRRADHRWQEVARCGHGDLNIRSQIIKQFSERCPPNPQRGYQAQILEKTALNIIAK